MSEAFTHSRLGAATSSPIRWIRIDALMSGCSGLLLAAGAPLFDGPLGAPVAFLVPLGLFLLGYAASLARLARAGAPAAGVKTVVVGNGISVVATIVAAATDALSLTTAGTVVALAQAAAVAIVADVQLLSLRGR
jgi:hypothetical protein